MVLLTAHHSPRINAAELIQRQQHIIVRKHFVTKSLPNVKAFATRKSGKRLRKQKGDFDLEEEDNTTLPPKIQQDDSLLSNKTDRVDSVGIPSRRSVLQACTLTSAFIAALALLIRQVSHVASLADLPILDCGAKVSFDFEIWHLELIAGLVVLISSSRYLLLKTWPDFATSSEVSNTQVLTSLDTFDYVIVAFLPGISEELLFRGALMPLLGLDWKSAFVTSAIFGILHLGNGRNYSFAAWATFVGLAYGYSTIISSSIVVAIASHALNNLVGALLWRYTSNSSKLQ